MREYTQTCAINQDNIRLNKKGEKNERRNEESK